MHLIFKDVQEESEIDFASTYLQLLSDDNKFRKKTAVGLHEVFKMFKNTDDDLTVYKECFLDLLGDDTPKIMKILNK